MTEQEELPSRERSGGSGAEVAHADQPRAVLALTDVARGGELDPGDERAAAEKRVTVEKMFWRWF